MSIIFHIGCLESGYHYFGAKSKKICCGDQELKLDGEAYHLYYVLSVAFGMEQSQFPCSQVIVTVNVVTSCIVLCNPDNVMYVKTEIDLCFKDYSFIYYICSTAKYEILLLFPYLLLSSSSLILTVWLSGIRLRGIRYSGHIDVDFRASKNWIVAHCYTRSYLLPRLVFLLCLW